MFFGKLKQIHAERMSEPVFGNRLKEAAKVIKDEVHVRKCNEAGCSRCALIGFNGRGHVHPSEQQRRQ